MTRFQNTALIGALLLMPHGSPAQTVKAVAGKAWGAPVAAALMEYGTSRIGAENTATVQRIAGMGVNLPSRATQNPALLDRLADGLAVQGLTPEAFAARPVAERIAALDVAARLAEARADGRARGLLAQAEGADEDDLAAELGQSIKSAAAQDMLYLTHQHEAFSALSTRVTGIEKTRQRAVKEFMRDLAKKINEGAYTAENTFVKVGRQWRAADEGPLKRYETLSAAYAARLKTVRSLPVGPWRAEMLAVMADALKQEHVRSAAVAESDEGSVAQLAQIVDAARQESDRLTLAPSTRRAQARGEFLRAGTVPSPRAVQAVFDEYQAEADRFPSDLASYYRILAHIVKGNPALGDPSYADLQKARKASRDIMHRRSLIALVAMIVSMVALAIAAPLARPHLSGLAGFGLVAVVMSIVAAMQRYIWLRDKLDNLRWDTMLSSRVSDFEADVAGRGRFSD
ncbi:MAG: hypothetical protein HYZ74_04785 [Elusimicrobia bacterium]|nr:hypothetical protein [Elusimicrobiota bacterium]